MASDKEQTHPANKEQTKRAKSAFCHVELQEWITAASIEWSNIYISTCGSMGEGKELARDLTCFFRSPHQTPRVKSHVL